MEVLSGTNVINEDNGKTIEDNNDKIPEILPNPTNTDQKIIQ